MPKLSPQAFELLDGLVKNNDREWFLPRKDEFKEHLQTPFAEILEAASSKLKRVKLPMSGGKHTMFRIYRDVRFSKDKRPYKENISGMLTVSGNKDQCDGLVYVHLDNTGGFLASGFYAPESKSLLALRQRIVDHPKAFQAIVRKLGKAGLELVATDKLKRMPRGFEGYQDHAHAELLKLKSFIIQQPLTKKAWLDGSVINEIVSLNKSATDLNLFGLEAIASVHTPSSKKGV
ncbi:MAG: DUF2461 domain-containing protein [Planctomycetota bacterium]